MLDFHGKIQNIKYQAQLVKSLKTFNLEYFNVNDAPTSGIIISQEAQIAYSKWVSPKRTRSYPFARIYNTYNYSKVLTIIPVIKDEGIDGDLDKIQYSTFSWMNLLNVYIVLSYYQAADKSIKPKQKDRQKLTNQIFDNDLVKNQISEIFNCKQSALHWNTELFDSKFTEIFTTAIDSYERISQSTSVIVHTRDNMDQYISSIKQKFSEFKNISLRGSQAASFREAQTTHKFEYLSEGEKATFSLENYLGGIYYLTPDEVFKEPDGSYIIQESKHTSSDVLPKEPDIQDGLFKLILFSNIHELLLDSNRVNFKVRLNLTSCKLVGSLCLPCDPQELDNFNQNNKNLKKSHIVTIKLLLKESIKNKILVKIQGIPTS